MIEYVINLALKIHSDLIIPIVGHQKNAVISFLNTKFDEHSGKLKYAHQDEQLGTGHAVMQTNLHMEDFDGDVLILSGDVPLLSYETVDRFLKFHYANNFDASLLSAIFDDPTGYGRIIRDDGGNFIDIVEHKDSNEEQLKIKEINSGIYIVDNKKLFEALKTLKTDNSQGEYYLTDIFKYFRDMDYNIGAISVDKNHEITGINTVEQLQDLENLYLSGAN
jgi:bifunctional N-acetylglucosamine-1-phosphate-uridyltransferase/glucosamine-1-phosphate-acetyltransferase GlmU-like protein